MEDFNNLMKQAQEMQAKMADFQTEMEDMQIKGTSGGGLIEVTLSGKGDMKGLSIDESLLKDEDKEVLEDLIIAAHSDARAKMEKTVAEKMQEATGGFQMPPGFSL